MALISVYPVAHNTTYVKATSYLNANYYPWFGTNPALSLTGAPTSVSWTAGYNQITNQKFNIDLGSNYGIYQIYLENYHSSGIPPTTRGIKNFSFYGTNSAVAFANTTYADTTDLTLLGTFEARQHTAVDESDPQYFIVDAQDAYRYYVFRIADQWGDSNFLAFRHIELQAEDGIGEGDLIFQPLSIVANQLAGNIVFSTLSFSGNGGGVGEISLPLSVAGVGGGVGKLYLDNITAAATGRLTTPVSLTSTIPYTIEGGFDVSSKTSITVSGTIPYVIAGGFQMDRTEIGGTIPYEITGGFDIHSEILIGLSGIIPYTITGGFDVSPHIPVSLVGDIPYTLTGGFAIASGVSDIDIEGTLPYTITGGFEVKSRAAMEIEGAIPYTIEGGFAIDSGDSCGGTLQYSEDAIC
ncbi:MAG: hypothetical protein WCY59_09635 [Anaerovoracaceae bacterium]